MSSEGKREIYHLDDLILDVGAVAVWRGAERISIPDLSFSTLVLLVRRAPDVVTHDELAEKVWRGAAITDETLTQRIALLRRSLGDDSREPRYIRAVRGRGYQLVPTPVLLGDETAPDSPVRSSRSSLVAVAIGVGLMLLILMGLIIFLRYEPTTEVPPQPTTSSEVSTDDLLGRARSYFDRHRENDNERAIELYEQALGAEPDNVAALAGLSLAYSQRTAKFNQSLDWARRAETVARRAVEIDPDQSESHHALGLALDSQGRLGLALESYRRAAEIDPAHLRAAGSGAYVLWVRGELAEALQWNLRILERRVELPYLEVQIADVLSSLDFAPSADAWYRKAETLRPDNLFAASAYGAFRLGQGDLTGAEEIVARALDEGVERPELLEIRGHLAMMRGDAPQAAELYRKALDVNPRSAAAVRLLAIEAVDDPIEHELRIREAIVEIEADFAEGNEWPPSAVELAVLATALGDFEAALTALDRAVDLGYRGSAWLLVDPALARLRDDPGFWPRIERIQGLVGAERAVVLSADWLPEGFLDAAR